MSLTSDFDFEAYEDLERTWFGARRERRHRPQPKLNNASARTELTNLNDHESDFVPTYAAQLDPLHYERQWVIDATAPFFQEGMISDVIRLVKGGKEANVYCCIAEEDTGVELAAAKLYRPRTLRQLKDDSMYKAGRILRGEDGQELRGRRAHLALKKKTTFGLALDTGLWIGKEVSLDRGEARPLFERVLANIRLMLDHHLVHGDLSAYNILYWEGQITIIDFPQMVDTRNNPHAQSLLRRDVIRVCQYFGRFGARANPDRLVESLWHDYMRGAESVEDEPMAGVIRRGV
jgi:RIO kinase 1